MHRRDLLQVWEEMVGLTPILACVDTLDCSRDRDEWSSRSPCFPPVTEP